MSLKSLIGLATAVLLSSGCTCSEKPPGASGEPAAAAPPAATETAPVPGIPSPMPRVGEPEEVMLFPGGSPRQIRRFEFPTFGASEFDVTMDVAEGEGDDVQRHPQLALGVRARIEKPVGRDGVRWSLEIIDATAGDADGVSADAVARADELAPSLVGARAVIDNDKRGRWEKTSIERGTPSGRRAMAVLLETIETLRGLGYVTALGPSAEWGHRETRRWNDIELRQTVQYTITRLEDREMDYSIAIKRGATDVPAPGGGTVERLVAQGSGHATVRFDRVMPTGYLAVATTTSFSPDAPVAAANEPAEGASADHATGPGPGADEESAPKTADEANQRGDEANRSASADKKIAGANGQRARDQSGNTASESGDAQTDGESKDGQVIRRSKTMIAISAREKTP